MYIKFSIAWHIHMKAKAYIQTWSMYDVFIVEIILIFYKTMKCYIFEYYRVAE